MPIRVGVLGCGSSTWWSRHLVATTFLPVAVCEQTDTLASAAAARFGLQRHYTDAGSLLQQEELDAVVIGPDVHDYGEVVRSCLQAGLHVYAWPPGATSPAEAEAFAAHAAYVESVGMVGFALRHAPAHEELYRLMRDRPFSRPLSVRLRWAGPRTEDEFPVWLPRAVLLPVDLLRSLVGDFPDMATTRLVQASGRYGVIVQARTSDGTVVLAEITSTGDPLHTQLEVEVAGVGWRAGAVDADRCWLAAPGAPVQTSHVVDGPLREIDRTGKQQALAAFGRAVLDGAAISDDYSSAARTLEHVERIVTLAAGA